MKALNSLAVVVIAAFLLPPLSTLVGAFTGWVVGLFFSETIMGFLGRIGMDVEGYQMWQVGAALGFIGGFFRVSNSGKSP